MQVMNEENMQYKSHFDPENPNWTPNSDRNLLFLKAIKQHMNNLLEYRGHLLLNDVYEALGFQRTSDGCIKGWLATDCNHIDMRYSLDTDLDKTSTIWITFVPQGVIYDKI